MLEGTENISVCIGLLAEQNVLFGNLLSEIESNNVVQYMRVEGLNFRDRKAYYVTLEN